MAKSEAEHEEDEEDRQRLADRVLGRLEDAVYWGIALVLIIGSVALLIAQFNTMLRLRNAPVDTSMLEVLDGLLLIFIFVELLYAVRACLRSHEIVAEPFLIVGILAGIKEIVVLSVEAATLLEKGPAFARAVVEIGVLAGVVLALALAAFVLRERRRDTEDAGEQAADEDSAARTPDRTPRRTVPSHRRVMYAIIYNVVSTPRERMVVSAALLIRERGAHATAISDVLEHSGAPRGSAYHYFPGGRTQLLGEAIEYAGDYVAGKISGRRASSTLLDELGRRCTASS